jgi:hypothetical protein
MLVPDLYRKGRVIVAAALSQLAHHFAGIHERGGVAVQRYCPRRFKRPASRSNCKKVFGQSEAPCQAAPGGGLASPCDNPLTMFSSSLRWRSLLRAGRGRTRTGSKRTNDSSAEKFESNKPNQGRMIGQSAFALLGYLSYRVAKAMN